MTFPYIPNIGITETLSWATDILKTVNGTESRIRLREFPRRQLQANFGPITETDWSNFLKSLRDTVETVGYIPIWPYSAACTEAHSISDVQIHFDTTQFPTWVGQKIFIIDPKVRTMELVEIDEIFTTSVNVTSGITNNYSSRSVVSPAIKAKAATSTIKRESITGESSITFDSWEEIQLQRDTPTVTVDTLNSLPFLDKFYYIGTSDSIYLNSDVLDFGGAKIEYSQYPLVDLTFNLDFPVSRLFDTDSMDWWWAFFDTVKGGQKAFVLSTNNNDLELADPQVNATYLDLAEAHPELDYDMFTGIRIWYSDGSIQDDTFTYVNSQAIQPTSGFDGSKSDIVKVSYLLKTRMGDTVTIKHNHSRSIISLEVFATSYG